MSIGKSFLKILAIGLISTFAAFSFAGSSHPITQAIQVAQTPVKDDLEVFSKLSSSLIQTKDDITAFVYSEGDVVVTIINEPCEVESIQTIIKSVGLDPATWRAGTVIFQGKHLNLCWFQKDENVYVVDEAGDGGYIPVDKFKPQTSF